MAYKMLKMLQDTRGEMLSRSFLLAHGITEKMIQDHERQGDVIVGGTGPLASIILTADGEVRLAEST